MIRITRRAFCGGALRAGLALGAAKAGGGWLSLAHAAGARPTYLNPVLGRDHSDAGAVRVGDDFYLTHSSFDYAPGLPIWHSNDLVNRTQVTAALGKYHGSVWAPYLCEHEGRFFIYFPCNNRLHVVHAQHPRAPGASQSTCKSRPSIRRTLPPMAAAIFITMAAMWSS
jgi:hypothetical protein